MRKVSILLAFLAYAVQGFPQQGVGTGYGFIRGTLINGKWTYSVMQKVNASIDFSTDKITIKDSSRTIEYRLLKDVLTKRIDEDSCIASLRTGYDRHNIRCMVNIVEFNSGVRVLNILYPDISYSYYFKWIED
jgi:hypothetical protein